MFLYKIYNDINDKIYIGITHDVKSRWLSHIRCKKKYPLYEDMRKYGVNNFHIEILEEIQNREEAKEKEIEYIKKYKTLYYQFGYNLSTGGENNACEDNPRSRLKEEDVLYIRNIYSKRITTPKKLWRNEFSEKISWSAFQKIWEGTTWKEISMDVYTEENISFYKKQKALPGQDNANSILTNEQVLKMRMYYSEHTLEETYLIFGKDFKSIDSFRACLNYSYRNIPRYNKSEKIWTLNNKEIEIKDYLKPVSTISESGE